MTTKYENVTMSDSYYAEQKTVRKKKRSKGQLRVAASNDQQLDLSPARQHSLFDDATGHSEHSALHDGLPIRGADSGSTDGFDQRSDGLLGVRCGGSDNGAESDEHSTRSRGLQSYQRGREVVHVVEPVVDSVNTAGGLDGISESGNRLQVGSENRASDGATLVPGELDSVGCRGGLPGNDSHTCEEFLNLCMDAMKVIGSIESIVDCMDAMDIADMADALNNYLTRESVFRAQILRFLDTTGNLGG